MTRADLRKSLMEKGLTYREARKVIDVIVESLRNTLRDKGRVEFPFGVLKMERVRPYRDYKLGRIVEYRRPKFTFKEKTDG